MADYTPPPFIPSGVAVDDYVVTSDDGIPTWEPGGGGGGGTPSDTVVGPDAFDSPSDAGVATEYSRGDHDHGLPAAPASLPPDGPAGGDLAGDYPDPTVAQIQGEPVSSTPPSEGYAWVYDTGSGAWIPTAIPLGISPGTGIGVSATGGIYTISNDGVISFNGRSGAVTPQSGDYTVGEVTGAAPLASPALTGSPTAPTKAPLTDNTDIATTAYTDLAVGVETSRAEAAESLLAPLASPALTGSPTAPTKAPLTDNTDIATTAYTDLAVGVEKTRAMAAESLLAPLASPALTGSPTAPTNANPSDSTTEIATDAFVQSAIAVVRPGRILATVQYAPSSASYTLAGAPLATVDSTNLTIAFTVPANGIVDMLVIINATLTSTGAANVLLLGWFLHGTTTLVGSTQRAWGIDLAETELPTLNVRFHLTGLTPGALQLDLAACRSTAAGSAGTLAAGSGANSNNAIGPALIQAIASV